MLRVVLAATLVLSWMPTASGQVEAWSLQDAQGDSQQRIGDTVADPLPVEGPFVGGHVDIDRLLLVEDADGFAFTVLMHPDQTGSSDVVEIDVRFRHGGQSYMVSNSGSQEENDLIGPGMAPLYALDGQGARRLVGGVPDETTASPPMWWFHVPREMIPGADGAYPREGSVLTEFQVFAGGAYGSFFGQRIQVQDLLPDDGLSEAEFVATLGAPLSGSAYVTSTRPSAASNGEAGTFVFPFTAHNVDDVRHGYHLQATAIPPAWTVQVAPPAVVIDGGANTTGHLIVTIPFAHDHGSRETFRLTLRNEDDTSDSHAMDFGIVFHEVPQPAGHHDTLWFHSTTGADADQATSAVWGDQVRAYMNALVDDPEDTGTAVGADATSRPIFSFDWSIRLSPSLAIGLEWIDAVPADLRFELESDVPHVDASITARLLVRGPDERGDLRELVLAEGGTAAPFTMQPGQVVPFELTLQGEPGRVPFIPRNELYLEMSLVSAQPTVVTAAEAPSLRPGGTLALPLLEFRDDVRGIAIAPDAFELRPASEVYRRVAAGGAVVLGAELMAHERVAVDLDATGHNAAWATVTRPAVSLPPGGSAQVAVVVQVPDAAPAREMADLILRARQGDDTALLRFVVEVDPEAGPGEPERAAGLLAEADHEAPSPLAFAMVAVAAAAWVGRRFRDSP